MSKTLSRIKEVSIDEIENSDVNQKKVKIIKAPLGRWAKLTKVIKSLINVLPEIMERLGIEEEKEQQEFLDNLTISQAIGIIPEVIDIIPNEYFSIISLGSGLDEDYIKNKIGFDDSLLLFGAILEVNKFKKEAAEVGKMLIRQLTGVIKR